MKRCIFNSSITAWVFLGFKQKEYNEMQIEEQNWRKTCCLNVSSCFNMAILKYSFSYALGSFSIGISAPFSYLMQSLISSPQSSLKNKS